MRPSTLVTRVRLTDYRSIAGCDVPLGPLTILVGPNGSGKSNFLDALRFVSDALTSGLQQAIRARGGASEILFASAGGASPAGIGLNVTTTMPDGATGEYALLLRVRSSGDYEVAREACSIRRPGADVPAHYTVERGGDLGSWGGVSLGAELAPARVHDRLYLVNASGLPEFRPLYDALSRMTFYNLNPALMREPRLPDPGDRLVPDGGNLASVLRRTSESAPALKARIEEYLAAITPGVESVGVRQVGRFEALEFRQRLGPRGHSSEFRAEHMSDGTLRALAVLVALFQAQASETAPTSLVAIEEPENALHPAAVGVLLDALTEAAETTQVMVTSHSADLLDRIDPDDVALLAVSAEDGQTRIGPIDRVGRTAIRERLYTPGELLRMNQLSAENGGVGDSLIGSAGPARE
jgi:predicted ATPase